MKKEMEYETVYILRPDLTDEMIKKANDKINETVVRYEGRPEALKDLGKKALAYPIAKVSRGHYFQLNYFSGGKVIEELERHLKMSEDVIRFLTVKAVHYEPYVPHVDTEGQGYGHGRHQNTHQAAQGQEAN